MPTFEPEHYRAAQRLAESAGVEMTDDQLVILAHALHQYRQGSRVHVVIKTQHGRWVIRR